MKSDDSRQVVIVDLETAGLNFGATVLEVAAVNLTTGEGLHFVPHLKELSGVECQAFEINRYFERGIWRNMLDEEGTKNAWSQLEQMLKGNTFAGCNPAFDALRLPIAPVWHHRLLDLSAYAAGVLNLPVNELPGLDTVCELLGVTIPESDRHTALGDINATAECFRRLMNRPGNLVKVGRNDIVAMGDYSVE